MEKQRQLFENLKSIKDYWANESTSSLNPNADLMWTNQEEAFKLLQSKLIQPNELDAFRKVQDDIIRGVIHSILVMIDGGDGLADKFNIDLIDENSKESLKEGIALHEEFVGYLIDVE